MSGFIMGCYARKYHMINPDMPHVGTGNEASGTNEAKTQDT